MFDIYLELFFNYDTLYFSIDKLLVNNSDILFLKSD